MSLNEADTPAKLIDPAIHKRGWTDDLIRYEFYFEKMILDYFIVWE